MLVGQAPIERRICCCRPIWRQVKERGEQERRERKEVKLRERGERKGEERRRGERRGRERDMSGLQQSYEFPQQLRNLTLHAE